MATHIIKATVDPSAAPTVVGVHYINTVSKKEWFSTGTATVADWVKGAGHTPTTVPIDNESAGRALTLADAGVSIQYTVAAPFNQTVPANATVAFEIGTVITFAQRGAGVMTLVGAGGVTLLTPAYATGLDSAGLNTVCTIHKVGTDTWLVGGSLA